LTNQEITYDIVRKGASAPVASFLKGQGCNGPDISPLSGVPDATAS